MFWRFIGVVERLYYKEVNAIMADAEKKQGRKDRKKQKDIPCSEIMKKRCESQKEKMIKNIKRIRKTG